MKNRNQFSDILHHSRLARGNGIWRLTGIFYFYALISTFPLGEALALPHTLITCTYTLKILRMICTYLNTYNLRFPVSIQEVWRIGSIQRIWCSLILAVRYCWWIKLTVCWSYAILMFRYNWVCWFSSLSKRQ